MKLYKDNNMLDKWVLLAYQSLFDNYYSVDGELYNELKKYYGEKEWQILKKEVYNNASKKQLYEYYKLDDEYENYLLW